MAGVKPRHATNLSLTPRSSNHLDLYNIMKRFSYISLLCGTVAFVSSCSMMEEDLDDCPSGLFVRFVYDYNTQRADMFKDHVGHVAIYLYDEMGNIAATREVSNTATSAPLLTYGYSMHFTPAELKPGRYRVQAIAMQKDWEEATATPGAKYRRNSPQDHQDLLVSLDCSDTHISGTERYEVSNAAPLDTLWHTLKVMHSLPLDNLTVPDLSRTDRPYSPYPIVDQMVEVKEGHATYATVSLIRDTKHLNITLRELDNPTAVYADHYEVRILDKNRHVAHDNEVLTSDSLHYSPYASWTSRFLDDGTMEVETVHTPSTKATRADDGSVKTSSTKATRADDEENNVIQRTAHYNVMFNRLMYNHTENEKNAVMDIINKETGKVVAHINLPSMLSQGRMAYELYNYGHQEYLDREYDYHLDFFLRGDKWLYCDIVINVLSWSKRTQNVSF